VNTNSWEVSSYGTKGLAGIMEANKPRILIGELKGGTPRPIVATEMRQHATPNFAIEFHDEQV